MNHKSLFPAQISLLRFGTYPTGCPEAPQIQQVSTSHTSPSCPRPIFHHPGSLSQWMTSQWPSFPRQKAERKPKPPLSFFPTLNRSSVLLTVHLSSFSFLQGRALHDLVYLPSQPRHTPSPASLSMPHWITGSASWTYQSSLHKSSDILFSLPKISFPVPLSYLTPFRHYAL